MRIPTLLLLTAFLSACVNSVYRVDDDAPREHFEQARAEIALAEAERNLAADDGEQAMRELAAVPDGREEFRLRLARARSLILAGSYAAAEEELAAAEVLDEESEAVALIRGQLAEARGRFEDAASCYALASRRAPDDLEPVLRQARALLAAGQPAAAAGLLDREAAVRPASVELLRAAGDARLAAGEPAAAAQSYQAAIAMRPEDGDLLRAAVLALALAGRGSEAADLGRDLEPNELTDPLNLALGRAALVAGRPEKGRDHLEHYLDIHPEDDDAWADLARACFLLGDAEGAFHAIGEALRRDPGDSRSLVLLGHLRHSAGQHQAALDCYLEAIRLGADAAPLAGIMAAQARHLQQVPAPAPEEKPAPEMEPADSDPEGGGEG